LVLHLFFVNTNLKSIQNMKRSILFVSLITILFATILIAQKSNLPIAKRWEKVDELASKQLPESALKEVEGILAQAQKEKNSVQVIKALVYKMRITLEKNPDEAPALIKDFEAFTEKSTDPAERALLHSMTAELYAQYYQNDSWTINNRTEVSGFVPDDMKEWTKNIYFDKISKHLAASMENAAILQKTDALRFATLLKKGKDSCILQPTLFDFLGYRKLQILDEIKNLARIKNSFSNTDYFAELEQFIKMKPDTTIENSVENQIVETYKALISYRLKSNNTVALLNLDLDRLEYFHSNSGNEKFDSLYLAALNLLLKRYNKNELIVEILAEKASYYYDKAYNSNYLENENTDINTINHNYKRIAFDMCSDGIKSYPSYKRIGLLKNIQKEITRKNINITYNKETPSSKVLKVEIKSENVSQLQLTVYRVNATALEYSDFNKNGYNSKDYPNRTVVETRQISIKPDSNFGNVTTNLFIKPHGYGIYNFTLEKIGNKNVHQRTRGTYVVTDLAFIMRITEKSNAGLYVLNRQTGKPQPNVNVQLYNRQWNRDNGNRVFIGKFNSDQNGFVSRKISANYTQDIYFFESGKDAYFSSEKGVYFNSNARTENEKIKVDLFTDRSLYRPGQTVYFKGIAYYSSKKKMEVAPNTDFEVILNDANSKKISSKKLKTNEFGSFAGEFVLPEGGLNGVFSIHTENGFQNFWVEEYKRPTFEVKMEKPKNEVLFGEKVTVTGVVKAYAGFLVSDADVKYRVVRSVHHFCWWFSEGDEEITNGTTKSNKDGGFEVSFVPVKGKLGNSYFGDRAYTYTVYADVTDTKGETQQTEQSVSVGDKSLFIVAEIPEKINKNETSGFEIYTETINDEKINSTLQYTLYRLAETTEYSENLKDNKEFKVADKILSGTYETHNTKLNYPELKNLASGCYKLIFSTLDTHGKEVKLEKVFILYSANDKRPPVKSYVWLQTLKTDCAVGESALIQFGTSTKNSMVLYEILQGNTILESRWIPFSDEIKDFEIPFKESYGAGVTAMFTFMKDEKLFTESVKLKRKVLEKKLTPTLSVFRDKLLPGEKAEWTITIPESVDSLKKAELMVDMYDASLDAIRSHSWNFYPVYRETVLYSPIWEANSFDNSGDNVSFAVNYAKVNNYSFDELNWFGLGLFEYDEYRTPSIHRSSKFTYNSIVTVVGNDDENGKDIADLKEVVSQVVEDAPPMLKNSVKFTAPILKNDEEVVDLNISKNKVQLRTNFNETAFFYPQLRTDADGNVKFTFIAPESLTRWNVKMLAHTQDLYFGQGEAQVVTQKDLMVQMNLPRFVRRSDKLVLSANVINLTDKELTANVQFEMIDPATDRVICTKSISPLSLGRGAGGEVVSCELTEFSPYELVICKVVARAGNFSDGEQKYLPVLPDKLLVTESMPMTIRGNQSRTFNFESLLKNGSKVDTKNLSVEFSTNPTWYAVQALPTISTPEDDNALDYFTAYYANSLAAFIANSNPKIAAIFDRWKKAGGSREALLSNLEKNKELKNMLLEETPWVMAAKDETEQKRQIALLFDLNMQKNQAQQYLNKLISLQLPSGAFSWFKGMGESRYITQEIMLNLARLKRMTGTVNCQLSTINLALNYLDSEIARDFENLKKYNKNYEKEMSVDNMQLFYLHLRSEYPEIPVPASAQAAVKFYTAQSEKYWTTFTLYGKAMMAVVAQRNGKAQIANEILKSLKENALKTDELGMYWTKNTSGYFWDERPIAVQAELIEAFTEVTKNSAVVDELKIWLLKQKQTQRWDSPMSTVDAIYALLLQGSDGLTNDGSVQIKAGNTTLQPASTEAGTGYFKQTIQVVDVRPEMGKVTVSSIESATSSRTPNSASIGWGAMYWQYYQDLDKIEGQGGSLKITKKLFVMRPTIEGATSSSTLNSLIMIPIENAKLVKGDKVITRLVITTDRNLEFVTLKDLRASCFEPLNQRSGCEWKESVCYYQTTKDASTQFFFSFLPKGTYVFEYALWTNNSGEYTSGIATIQCQYAPEFVSHTGGERIIIK